MQRIDENTYIDDSLVTCAEYQLFIDEMREQGRYYQPDHWTAYQYPKEQAREPVLGVRYSYALAFCDWLTNHEVSEWKYHLPSQEDITNFPMKPHEKRSSGYWLGIQSQFAWIGLVPNDAFLFDRDFVYDRIHNLILGFNRARDLIRDVTSTLEQIIVVANRRDRNFPPLIFVQNLSLDLNRDLAHKYGLIQELDLDLNDAHGLSGTFVRAFDSAHVLAQGFSLADNQARDLILSLENAIVGTRDSGLDFGIDSDLHRTLKMARDLKLDLVQAGDLVSKIDTDLHTLQERIAGRSPAFEGIRLVKERIR